MKQMQEPFLCVITPVFDQAIDSLRGLISDLQQQNDADFIHVCISNGDSPIIKKYINENIFDGRFIYDETPYDSQYENSGRFGHLLANIGMRRDFVFKKYNAKRYLNLGADFEITDSTYISRLKTFDDCNHMDIIISKIMLGGEVYPKSKLCRGNIDLSNFSISKHIAKSFDYPKDFSKQYQDANDWRYFEKIYSKNNTSIMDGVFGNKDGRQTYKSLALIYNDAMQNNQL